MPARPTHVQAPTDRASVARLAGEFLETRGGELHRFARSYVGAAHQAVIEDVVQSALVAFIQSFPGGPDDREGAWAYLLRAVKTAAWKSRRGWARKTAPLVSLEALGDLADEASARTEGPLVSTAPEPCEALLRRERYQRDRRLLAQLPPDQRECLILGAFGFATREIATALALTDRQVRKRVEKANRRLRELERGAR